MQLWLQKQDWSANSVLKTGSPQKKKECCFRNMNMTCKCNTLLVEKRNSWRAICGYSHKPHPNKTFIWIQILQWGAERHVNFISYICVDNEFCHLQQLEFWWVVWWFWCWQAVMEMKRELNVNLRFERDFRLLPQSSWELHSSGLLYSN